jgi:organic radical activating enzyme
MIPSKKTFCIAPFQHACVDSKGDLSICCVSNETKEYRYEDIKEWYESDTLKSLRHNLVNGVKDPICEYCWTSEEYDGTSQREIYNRHIGKITSDWDKSFEKNKKLMSVVNDIDYKNINSFDLKLGNLCNLKCIMCSTDNSSQLLAEARMYPELKQFYDEIDPKKYQWPEKEEFKNWCKTFLGSSIHIKFTGGEPFLNPYLLEVLTNIPLEQRKKCILQFTTNLTSISNDIMKILSSFKETWFSVSVEGIDEIFEYARFGHSWKTLQKNLLMLLDKQSKKNIFVSINHVIQSPTFNGIIDLIQYFDSLKTKIQPIFLNSPTCYSLLSIKQKVKENFLEQIKNYKGYNLPYVISLRSHIRNNIEHDPKLAEQCVHRLETIDKIRKKDFKKIIPIDYFL